jgi:hypothetical protein
MPVSRKSEAAAGPTAVVAPLAPALLPETEVVTAPPISATPDGLPGGLIDPYAGATKLPTREIKVVQAPPESSVPAREPTVVSAPKPTAESETAPLASPSPPATVEPAEPVERTAATPVGPATLSRKELDGALANLESLSSEIDLRLTRAGVVVERVSSGTLGHRLGLRTGDLIRSVAGIPTRKLEDGADVYVRLGQVDRFSISITRAGQKLDLPVVIK